ncbi:hypothetical protein H6P81_006992 [Aristolochia fimbriata]|uniref:Uncharacterized protein n=1 Tax=Aristolochia fimbriata TaxID=158543 RepID=A0AAV7EZ50_ARIFI|nr:hypothetical protein H6P81_006992 [Aristolochia fimbriata]
MKMKLVAKLSEKVHRLQNELDTANNKINTLYEEVQELRERDAKREAEIVDVYRLQTLRMIHEVGINSRYFDGIEALFRYLTLDEVDKLVDLGFENDANEVLDHFKKPG